MLKIQQRRAQTSKSSGVTLIELMVSLAVVGILVAAAVPVYTSHVQRVARTEAITVLMDAALYMQRFYGVHHSYSTALNGASVGVEQGDGQLGLPIGLNQSPRQGVARYLIGFKADSLSALSFTLQAVPQGAQAQDACGTLTLTQTGLRGASGGAPVADCWK